MKKTMFRIAAGGFLSLLAVGAMGCSQNELKEDYLAESGDNGGDDFDSKFEVEGPDEETSANWTIIFEDNFEGESSVPDNEKWVLCERGNDSWNRHLSESYDQAYQKDGILYLLAEKVDGEYETGGIETRGKFDFQYGKLECRARFDRRPKGNHTGIWMMPSPPAEQWPKSGEIDIMEHLNKEWKIYETVHSWYADDMGHKDDPMAQKEVSVNPEDWNTYGLIWTPEKLIYTVNGENHLEYPNLHLEGEDGAYQWPFDHPFYIILSQSLGGEGTWAGEIDDEELPAIFQIDWIKVWKDSNSEGAGVPMIRE